VGVNREIASEIDQHAVLPNETFAPERKKPRPLKSNVIEPARTAKADSVVSNFSG